MNKITQRLDLRQSQNLVMTPQLQQAIKLLQLSNIELAEVVDAKPETVCRALAQLLPPRTRKGGPPRGWRQVAAAAVQAIQPTDSGMTGALV